LSYVTNNLKIHFITYDQIRNIHKSYTTGQNSLHVLKGIDLNVEQGDMISVMGASGSGKSTLLNILGILDTYDQGEYLLNGLKINKLSEKKAAQLRNKMLGFVFQSFNLISFKNAMENVAHAPVLSRMSNVKSAT